MDDMADDPISPAELASLNQDRADAEAALDGVVEMVRATVELYAPDLHCATAQVVYLVDTVPPKETAAMLVMALVRLVQTTPGGEKPRPPACDPDHPLDGIGDLALLLGGSETSFTGQLLLLIAKADPGNRARLAVAFPRAVRAWELWQATSPTPIAVQLLAELAAAEGW